VVFACNLLATIQVVWFYLAWIQPYLHAPLYEQGLERTPFQGRLLMMLPMRWAHQSHFLDAVAGFLTRCSLWFESGVIPEGVLQATVDVVCVGIAGLVARAMYRKASPTGALTGFVYPITLVMIAATFDLTVIHHFRMIYDLPSLGLFAAGLYLIYFRHWVLFIPLFVAATINRETSILLLAFFVLFECWQEGRFQLRFAFAPRTVVMSLLFVAFWCVWHWWVGIRFAANPTEYGTHLKDNLVFLINPFSWPQLFSAGAFTVPLLLLYRRRIGDPVLRLWLWVLLPWFGLMLVVGILIESRIFGELIPYFACCVALIAESLIPAEVAPKAASDNPLSRGWSNPGRR
jgi:hypothetical protein